MSFGKRMNGLLAGAALSLAVFAGAVLIGTGAFAQEFSESHVAAAKSTLSKSRSTDQFDNILPRMADSFKTELIRDRPDAEAQISVIVDEAALAVAGRRGDLENEAAQIFARTYTEEELEAIGDFFGSEVGQKFLRESPVLLRELGNAARVWTNGLRRDMGNMISEKLQEAGLTPQPAE